MTPIFDRNGKTVGWINNRYILNSANKYQAILNNNKVYAISGNYLGEFKNGYFWDKQGRAVAFIKGAKEGPIPPIPQIPPIPPVPPVPPIPSIPRIPPIPSIHTFDWSNLSFENFLTSTK